MPALTAKPKSPILTVPSIEINKFAGLMSGQEAVQVGECEEADEETLSGWWR